MFGEIDYVEKEDMILKPEKDQLLTMSNVNEVIKVVNEFNHKPVSISVFFAPTDGKSEPNEFMALTRYAFGKSMRPVFVSDVLKSYQDLSPHILSVKFLSSQAQILRIHNEDKKEAPFGTYIESAYYNVLTDHDGEIFGLSYVTLFDYSFHSHTGKYSLKCGIWKRR